MFIDIIDRGGVASQSSLELEYYQRRFARELPAAPLSNRGRRLADERARMEAEGKFKMPDFTKLR